MRKHLVLLVALVALSVSCGVATTATELRYEPPFIAPTATNLATTTATAQPTARIVGSWHLRQSPSASGTSVIVSDCAVTILDGVVNEDMSAWYLVETDGGLVGWINARGIEQ